VVATPIGLSTRYIPEGTVKFYWVVSIATYTSPTRAELNAGTDLSPQIAAMGDWDVTATPIAAPDLVSTFVSQIAGTVAANNTTLDMYADQATSDARTLMPRNSTGYIVKFMGGDVTGRKMDVFPVTVAAAAKATTLTTPVVISFTYVATRIPAEDVAVP